MGTKAVQFGELKLAEGLIRQRVDATRKAINEAETLRLEGVRRKVEKEMGLEKAVKAAEEIGVKTQAKVEAIQAEYAKKNQDLADWLKKKKEDIDADRVEVKAKLDELKAKIADRVGEEGAEIKKKAASMRAHLDQELARLNDSIYAAVLPANLRAVVDEAPRIGYEASRVSLQFDDKIKTA